MITQNGFNTILNVFADEDIFTADDYKGNPKELLRKILLKSLHLKRPKELLIKILLKKRVLTKLKSPLKKRLLKRNYLRVAHLKRPREVLKKEKNSEDAG